MKPGMTPEELAEELAYISYKANRDRAPHITPDRWSIVYPDVAKLEKRYQREKAERETT